MEDGRRQRQFGIVERLENLKTTPPMFLPQGTVLKEFVRQLQKDLKAEADTLLEEEEHYKAGLLFTEALTMNKYLRNQGYERDWSFDKRVYLARAECGIGMEVYSASIDDCDAVLTVEKDNLRAMVIQIVAEFEDMMRYTGAEGPLQSELWEFERKLEKRPERVRSHQRVKVVIERLFACPGMQTDLGRKAKQRLLASMAAAAAQPDPPLGVDAEWLPQHVVKVAKTASKQKTKPSKKKQKAASQQPAANFYAASAGNDIYQSDSDEDFLGNEDDDAHAENGLGNPYAMGKDMEHMLANGNWETIGKGKKKMDDPIGKLEPAQIGSGLNALDDFGDLSLDSHIKRSVVKTIPTPNSTTPAPTQPQSLASTYSSHQSQQHKAKQQQQQQQHQQQQARAAQAAAAAKQAAQAKAVALPQVSPETQEWLQRFVFRLACQACWIKISGKWGYGGHKYLKDKKHACRGGWLVARLDSMRGVLKEELWGRIRQRTKPDFKGRYSLCQQFITGISCKIEEDSCWFCHSHEEMAIWEADRKGQFKGPEIVTYLRAFQNIGMSAQQKEAAQGKAKAQQQAKLIPNANQFQPPNAQNAGFGGQDLQGFPGLPQQQTESLIGQPIQFPLFPNNGGDSKQTVGLAPVGLHPTSKPSNSTPLPRVTQSASGAGAAAVANEEEAQPLDEKTQIAIQGLLSKVQGQFIYLCQACFDGAPPCMSTKVDGTNLCSNEDGQHNWDQNKTLVHVHAEGGKYRYWKIRQRPNGIPARAFLCWHREKKYGCVVGNTCKFGHNAVEVEVWEFEVFNVVSRDNIVQYCAEVARALAASQVTVNTSTSAQSGKPKTTATTTPVPTQSTPLIPPFRFTMKLVCDFCYTRKREFAQNPNNPTKCSGPNPHDWLKPVCLLWSPTRKRWHRVYPRHQKLRADIKPCLCRHGERCDIRGIYSMPCMFPHIPEEVELWNYMGEYKLKTLEEVFEVTRKNKQAGAAASAAVNNRTATAASADVLPTQALHLNKYYCSYCSQAFPQMWRLEMHMNQPEHKARINSDKERSWKYRSPPWNVLNGDYKLCQKNLRNRCLYSETSQEKNNCTDAHSIEELEEWKERHEYRMMKMKKAKDQKLYSFMDELLTKYNFSTAEMSVMAEELPNIRVHTKEELSTFLGATDERKGPEPFTYTWRFQVKTMKQKSLKRVGLLYDEHRLHFYLNSPPEEDKPQVCPGKMIAKGQDMENYSIDVIFHSQMLGSFHQWVVFDFGTEPVLVRKLSIHVGSEKDLGKYTAIKERKEIKTWDSSNSKIERYGDVDHEAEVLYARYKPPASLSIDDIGDEQLNKENYKHHMHKMLFLEELECMKRIARYSGETTMSISSDVTVEGFTGSVFLPAGNGLFGKINLTQTLCDDSEASQIVLSSVQYVLVKFDTGSSVVFQTEIIADHEKDGRTEEYVYVRLNETCVRLNKLVNQMGKEIKVDVQFQLNRLPFCNMHFAVDKIKAMEILFPTPKQPQRFPHVRKADLFKMNPRQEGGCRFISNYGGSRSPHPQFHGIVGPVLIYGPFGTGKTHTVARSVMRTLEQRRDVRILICTHSNSAADWYISEHLQPFFKQSGNMAICRLLRIYFNKRSTATIDPSVLPFVLLDGNNSPRYPTRAEIINYNIIITTLSTALVLARLELEGFFTHIFIDEAGQALETEAVIPLTMATKETCVVLAGDHIQMSPKVYCETARIANFHVSLLERLQDYSMRNRCQMDLLLTFNYRTRPEILEFISETHYKVKLDAKGDHPRHPEYYPLVFCTVKGEDQLLGTSYVNHYEVLEIAYRIETLCRDWPADWGEKDRSSVCVMTPYSFQVRQLRRELRRRKLHHVTVETVQNVQGKQFRCVFISTVRTRSTLNKAHITAIDHNEANRQDGEYYYGFLSDIKLLNTAFTRAQSLLVVVGDPVALCSVGSCSQTWKSYVSECEKHDSLYPKDVSVDKIQQEIMAAKQRLNPFAKSFKPSKESHGLLQSSLMQPAQVTRPVKSVWGSGKNPWGSSPVAQKAKGPTVAAANYERLLSEEYPALPDSKIDDADENDETGSWIYEEEEDGETNINDAILQELRRQVLFDHKEIEASTESSGFDEGSLSQADYSLSSEGLTQDYKVEDDVETQEEIRQMDVVTEPRPVQPIPTAQRAQIQRQTSEGKAKFRMVQSGNQILLVQEDYKRAHLQGAADFMDEYDSDDSDDDVDADPAATEQYKKLAEEQPDKFKVCIFRYDPSGRIYAVPKDSGSTEEIVITSKKRRGQALDCDEVIIEILEDEDELDTVGDVEVVAAEAVEDDKSYGKVVHILKRASDPRLRKIVCTLDPYTDNLMVPIDRTFPKLYAMTRKDSRKKKPVKSLKTSEKVTVSVYSIKKGESFHHEKNIIVNNKERPNKLFVVQYWSWFEKTPYPMGLVTEELPPGDNPRDGLHILKLVHNVKEKWKANLESEILENFPDNWKIPAEEFQQREDLRNKMVFTVDPPESRDLDDAISIEELPDERFVVGIHIADVSYFVAKESALDLEVRGRATSYYPSFAKPIHMLPPQLSTRLCSLLPEADRLTISVFITLDHKGNIVDNARIVKSVIRSYIQLSYDDVEKVINSEDRATVPGIRECILMLHGLAKERRRQRLGDGRFAYSHEDDEVEVSHPQAHSMVEEMMLLANLTVAKFLIYKFPQCTLLRRQLSPDKVHLQQWVDDNFQDIKNSVSLLGNRSLMQSTQIPANANNPLANHSITLLKETWNKLQSSVQSDDNVMNKIIDIVCTDQNHPQLAAAHAQFYRLMERADYICSGDYPAQDKHSHYSLCMSEYTHFTSPIRRYSDLVIHRMLVSAMYGETTPPYTQEEMSLLCHHCTAQSLNAKSFEMKTRALQLALKAKEAPLPMLSYVEKVSDTSIQLLFPGRRYIPPNKRSVGLQLLKPIQKPDVNEDEGSINLKWKQRVYDRLGHLKSRVPPNATQELETLRFTVQVPERQWHEILTGIKTDDIYQIKSAVEVTRNDIERVEREREALKSHPTQQPGVRETVIVDEVVSENMNETQARHSLFVEFQREYKQSDVVQLQVHASLQKGVLGPSIQLFNMTPCLDLCTEHRADAVACFADVATQRPQAIKNISKYKEVWLPILEMMNAHNAVYNDETVVIHGVEIQWQRHFLDDEQRYLYQGSFQLPKDFCEARHIHFSYPRKYNAEEQGNEDVHLDYLCIRYNNLEVPYRIQFQLQELDQKPGVPRPKDHMPHPGQMAFVVHATTTDVQNDKRSGLVIVQFEVNQFSSPFPDVLLGRQTDDIPVCTLELIPKTEPDRRLEEAVRQLDKATPLIRDICLLQKPRTTGADDTVAKLLPNLAKNIRLLEVPGCPLSRPNKSQQAAIRSALDQPFAIIQGPPGTGKTVTGAYVAYFFNKMNKKLPPMGKGQPQVLYCGPSNKSVDVIAEYLKQMNISVVRVYSETIERKEFPIPGAPTAGRKAPSRREARMDDKHEDISLHHLIRKQSNEYHEAIKQYDEMFRTQGYRASLSDVLDYKRTITAAEEQELKKYQIVLCTCNASGSRRIRDYTTIIQCIVDEAGMCNEPETLIPLVNTKPSQVVLIGDHQQLRPIIQERTAQLLGMETSLLEKYKSKALMLKTQYRMHEAICDFPSAMFYHGELETADIIKMRRPDPPGMNIWPGGDQRPTVFCHVYGREETLTVKTAEGNEKSKSNPQEVYHAVRIATTLVNRFNVKPENIIVLSQYRLQCSEIEKELHKKGHKQVKVSTVITSQGSEWDYVIMSTVRSLPRIEIEDKPSTGWKLRHLGFIMDENQMNVALSRAKRGLIIVGNQYLLQTHDLWNELLSNYRQHGSVVEARSFPRVR